MSHFDYKPKDFILFILVTVFIILSNGQPQPPSSDPNQFDQILRDLDMLTRQQLASQAAVETSTSSSSTTTSTTTPSRSSNPITKRLPTSLVKNSPSGGGGSSAALLSGGAFTLPPAYDPNRLPRFSRIKPLLLGVNMTILHINVDKHESTINLDVEIVESWRDKRLRLRKTSADKSGEPEDDFASAEEDDDEVRDGRGKSESYLWNQPAGRPVSGTRIPPPNSVKESPDSKDGASASGEVASALVGSGASSLNQLQKTIEQEALMRSIVVTSNETTAQLWLSLKVRIRIPMYECARDDSSLYPFDKVRCTLSIANVIYDRRNLQYRWEHINWLSSGYQTGEFYLRALEHSVTSERLLDLDQDHSEHSTLRLEMLLRRQIGDYVLNVYLLHLFLLGLCVASFWISIDNIVIRMSLSIIVLIIIKFQTIQTLGKDDSRHQLVSALSIWTFGLSVLVILSLLAHILSYYSVQHEWNDKILNRLVVDRKWRWKKWKRRDRGEDNRDNRDGNEMVENPSVSSVESSSSASVPITMPPLPATPEEEEGQSPIRQRWAKVKQNCLIWLNSIILSHSRKDEGYDRINLVDIIARVLLLIIYLLFVLIYFFTYVF
ncbi:hypothetical protein TYRP_020650 [Tyrophagus putrescentiae]|nr:hypothetical protein TYRP_020650 [Tyrophagus putrescentiae]